MWTGQWSVNKATWHTMILQFAAMWLYLFTKRENILFKWFVLLLSIVLLLSPQVLNAPPAKASQREKQKMILTKQNPSTPITLHFQQLSLKNTWLVSHRRQWAIRRNNLADRCYLLVETWVIAPDCFYTHGLSPLVYDGNECWTRLREERMTEQNVHWNPCSCWDHSLGIPEQVVEVERRCEDSLN